MLVLYSFYHVIPTLSCFIMKAYTEKLENSIKSYMMLRGD